MQAEQSIGTAVAQIMPGCNQQEGFKKKKWPVVLLPLCLNVSLSLESFSDLLAL